MYRIGYFLSEKKERRYKLHELSEEYRNDHDIELVKINLDESIEEQGPFTVIYHHVNNLIGKSEQGDEKARVHLNRFKEYVENHPDVVLVNPLEGVYKLLDRQIQYNFIRKCSADIPDCDFYVPSFVEFHSKDIEENKRLMMKNGVTYPLICKPSNSSCHKMLLIFDENGLHDVEPPCIVQTFVNHGAKLFKVMVLNESAFVFERPSIRDFDPGTHNSIYFDSQEVSKTNSCGYLNQNGDVQAPVMKPNIRDFEQLALKLKQYSGLDLLGVDVIIDKDTGKYYVIDANAFPSFDSVANFRELLLELFRKCISKSKERLKNGDK